MIFKIEALMRMKKKILSNTTIFDGVILIWSYAKIWNEITYAIILLTSVIYNKRTINYLLNNL